MRENVAGLYGILKYFVTMLVVVFVVLLYLFTSGSRKPFDEMAEVVEQTLEDSGLVIRSGQEFKKTFGMESADFDGVLFYRSESAGSAEEVLLVQAGSRDQALETARTLREHLKKQKTRFSGYDKEETSLVESAQLCVRGRYVFLAVSPNARQYTESFSRNL